jgi:hypothetical protein
VPYKAINAQSVSAPSLPEVEKNRFSVSLHISYNLHISSSDNFRGLSLYGQMRLTRSTGLRLGYLPERKYILTNRTSTGFGTGTTNIIISEKSSLVVAQYYYRKSFSPAYAYLGARPVFGFLERENEVQKSKDNRNFETTSQSLIREESYGLNAIVGIGIFVHRVVDVFLEYGYVYNYTKHKYSSRLIGDPGNHIGSHDPFILIAASVSNFRIYRCS